MSQQYVPNLGETPSFDARRDAVHVAVVPVTAHQDLSPGMHFGIRCDDGTAYCADSGDVGAVGVVDPFYRGKIIKAGQRFWGYIYPGTVTSLRHVWSHPAFVSRVPNARTGEA